MSQGSVFPTATQNSSDCMDCNSTGCCVILLLAPWPLLKFIIGHTCTSCFNSLEKNQPNMVTRLLAVLLAYIYETLNTITPGPLYYGSLSRETRQQIKWGIKPWSRHFHLAFYMTVHRSIQKTRQELSLDSTNNLKE